MNNVRKYFLPLLLSLSCAVPLSAQGVWDGPFKNLKVFPSDVSGDQLRAAMQGFTRSLGVRCEYCHDDSKGSSFRDLDFVSEVKPAKETARVMIRMTRALNSEYLSSIQSADATAVQVNCETCHRGVAVPQSLLSILEMIYEKDGIDAALEKYDTLRARHYGGSAYDFTSGTLNELGYGMLEADQPDDAIKVFQKNAEVYPDEAITFAGLGDAYFEKNDKALALSFYQKALMLDPRRRDVRDQINELLKSAAESSH